MQMILSNAMKLLVIYLSLLTTVCGHQNDDDDTIRAMQRHMQRMEDRIDELEKQKADLEVVQEQEGRILGLEEKHLSEYCQINVQFLLSCILATGLQ